MSHVPPDSYCDPGPAPPTEPVARCAVCGYDLRGLSVDKRCPECGTPIWNSYGPQRTSGLAIASMVLGIVSIPICAFYGLPSLVCGILAVVFANRAEAQILAQQASPSSLGMIKAGRICGWVGIALSVVFWLVIVLFIVSF